MRAWVLPPLLLLVGCASDPLVIAEVDAGGAPTHAVNFDIANSTDQCFELEIWIDGVLVIEGTVQDRGSEHCFQTHRLQMQLAEGTHGLQFDPGAPVRPFDFTVDGDMWLAVGFARGPFVRLADGPAACR